MAIPNLSNEQRDQLVNEWHPDADGILSRNAARIVLFNHAGATFLIKGHDFGDTDHAWWFTVGGGLEPDESPQAGACRELCEETGLQFEPDRLVGPVMSRHAIFRFAWETRRQHELFFIATVTQSEMERIGNSTHLTALEEELLDEYRWWEIEAIPEAESRGETVYPQNFASYAEAWRQGWDGTCTEVWEQ